MYKLEMHSWYKCVAFFDVYGLCLLYHSVPGPTPKSSADRGQQERENPPVEQPPDDGGWDDEEWEVRATVALCTFKLLHFCYSTYINQQNVCISSTNILFVTATFSVAI